MITDERLEELERSVLHGAGIVELETGEVLELVRLARQWPRAVNELECPECGDMVSLPSRALDGCATCRPARDLLAGLGNARGNAGGKT